MERLDGEGRRDLAGVVSTHAVRHHKKARGGSITIASSLLFRRPLWDTPWDASCIGSDYSCSSLAGYFVYSCRGYLGGPGGPG